MLRAFHPFFHESLIIATPFLIFILARSHWDFASCGAGDWIPTLGFGN
jgi:hypothetical protein